MLSRYIFSHNYKKEEHNALMTIIVMCMVWPNVRARTDAVRPDLKKEDAKRFICVSVL